MSNQQSNYYGTNPQSMTPEQWSVYQQQLLNWQYNQYQQSSYQHQFQQQPFSHQTPNADNQFSIPPPPPPEQPQSSNSTDNNSNKNVRSSQSNGRPNNQYNPNSWMRGGRGNSNARGGSSQAGGNVRGGGNKSQFSNQFQSNEPNTSANQQQTNSSNINNNNTQQQQGNFNNNPRNNRKNNNNWNNRNNQSTSSAPRLAFQHAQIEPTKAQSPLLPQTPEDIAFEEEFRKWEEQFEQWKKENQNHPDKTQYKAYEKQFMDVREKLLSRREEMRKRKLETEFAAVPVKTAEQKQFESQWLAGDPSKESTPFSMPTTLFDPKPSTNSSQLPSTSSASETAVSAASIMFGESSRSSDDKKRDMYENFDDDDDDYELFDDKSNKTSRGFQDKKFEESSKSIPGLEFQLPGLEFDENDVNFEPFDPTQEVAIVPEDQVVQRNARLPPPIPIFRAKAKRHIIDIRELLEEPGRSNRPDKIMILIRGAPGSGKHFIADLIQTKENKMQNDRCQILSIDKYIQSSYNTHESEYYNQKLFEECRDLIREGYNNFLIVILNGCSMTQFNKISHMATSYGQFQCFSMEVHQKSDICMKYNVNNRINIDILNACEDLDRYTTPRNMTMIDATSLLDPKHQFVPDLPKESSDNFQVQQPEPSSNIQNIAENIAQLLQNRNVMELLQNQLNVSQPTTSNQNQIQPLMMQNIQPHNFFPSLQNQRNDSFINNEENIPLFKPLKVIDYDHEHKQTFEEQLMEFKIFRTIEYSHHETKNLNEFVRDVDIDKIIEKRKAVALRKKILDYLRNAERPEDTVSNPKYPKNWEMIVQERPPRRNKRKKVLTAKIKRVLLHKSRDQNSWMTTGYKKDHRMDLEEISSDDDMDEERPPQKIKIIIPQQKISFNDPFKNVPKTTPDFNYFNHPRVIDIKNILYQPERRSRPNQILIILRGAPGSGKSHLVQLIKRKESEMGNSSNIRILSIDDYFLTEEDEDDDMSGGAKSYLDEMQKVLKKTITDGLHNVIIIDAENCDLISYNQFYQTGSTMGVAVYTIELYQTFDICSKQGKRTKTSSEINNAIELLNKNRIPDDHTLLIPSILYNDYECFMNPKLNAKNTIDESSKEDTVETTFKNYLVQTIDEKCLTSMPQFNWHNREIMKIEEILNEPGRNKRGENVMILMRGPGGSGKTELASTIMQKEKSYGNENVKFISMEDFFINTFSNKYEFNSQYIELNMHKLMKQLREIMRPKTFRFLIVDIETGEFTHYERIHQLASSLSYKCYTIELYQDTNICMENDIYKRPIEEIDNVLEQMQFHATPAKHILLDASVFYKQTTAPSSNPGPLKSALKISPNTSINLEIADFNNVEKFYNSKFTKLNIHDKFQVRHIQRLQVGGEFIERISTTPKLPEFNWFNQDIIEIRDILDESSKIAIFIRGAPGSGKTFLARLIERKQAEMGNVSGFKLLSIDEYFEAEKFRSTGKNNQYEKFIESNPDESKIDYFMEQLCSDFENVAKSNKFSFIVLDGDFTDLKYYTHAHEVGKNSGYSCYTIEINQDDDICVKYNDHKYSKSFVLSRNERMREIETPKGNLLLDPEVLYHEYKYEFNPHGDIFLVDEDMEVIDISEDEQMSNEEEEQVGEEGGVGSSFGKFKVSAAKSKWDDNETADIDRLDGTKSKTFLRVTMADYLQSDEEWSMRPSTSGKKRVRWADIEEKKEQERMRKIGFIVGHTDWKRMVDDSDGRSALEKTKFIEPRHKN